MTRRVRDPLARPDERAKLIAGFFDAIGSGLIGFAVLRPVAEVGIAWAHRGEKRPDRELAASRQAEKRGGR